MKPHATSLTPSGLSTDAIARIADGLGLAFAVFSGPELTCRFANRRFMDFTGGREPVGHRWRELFPHMPELAFGRVWAVAQGTEGYELSDLPMSVDVGEPARRDAYLSVRVKGLEIDGEPGVLVEVTDTTQRVVGALDSDRVARDNAMTAEVLSSVFESMADGFFTLDPDWRFTYINHRAEELLHKARTDLLGKRIWEVFPETVGSVFHQEFTAAAATGKPSVFEEYYSPHDMWASVHVLPSDRGLTVYLSDITSQKQAEAAVVRSEGQLRAVVDNSPSVIYMKDLDGRFILVNEQFARRFGRPKEGLIGCTDYEVLPKDSADRVTANDDEVLKRGEAMQFEEDIRMPNGDSIVYLTAKFPLRDASGRIYGTAGISTNVNDRIRQERALAESEQRFRKIFEEGPLGVALLDTTQTFRQVNDRYAEMLGYNKEELPGKTIAEVTHPDFRDLGTELPRRLVRGEIPFYRIEKLYLRKDGSSFWASIHGSLVRDDTGKPAFILALAEDITQRRAAEEMLRDKDKAIRAAYSDVIAAVTGGKIVLMTGDEIEEALGPATGVVWRVSDYCEFSAIRHELATQLAALGMTEDRSDAYVLAASEAFTNAVKHGHGGEVRVHRTGDRVQIVVSDHGPGIDFENLPRATLVAGFSTAQTLGMGFTVMLQICDRLLLSTQPGLTVVVLESLDAADEVTP